VRMKVYSEEPKADVVALLLPDPSRTYGAAT
jgi:hypothetical protein